MKNKEVILAGSGHGALAALSSLQKKFEVVYLYSDDSELISKLRPQDHHIRCFYDVECRLLVCAAYSKIIEKDILNEFTVINTHPSLLPRYRGIHSLVWAMLNLEPNVGFTIHLMNESIDDGPILEQFTITVGDYTSKEIMDKFDMYVLNNLGRVVLDYIDGYIEPRQQDIKFATWCTRRNLEDCLLDFELSHEEILATFKALVAPYPLPIISIKGEFYFLSANNIIFDKTKMHNGRVVNIQDGMAYIKCMESIILTDKLIRVEDQVEFQAVDLLKFGMRL